jgi:hypothetical protein
VEPVKLGTVSLEEPTPADTPPEVAAFCAWIKNYLAEHKVKDFMVTRAQYRELQDEAARQGMTLEDGARLIIPKRRLH